ncbi:MULTISPECIES: hypothetical protein [Planktothricoides]|uniref:Uncharacterized protein n=2 Tax=Planktothricoides raciborskii TaxID=132608 RepID=A0AAU8JDL4_9CYAN|nr:MULTISPECIES: hypothetical protein [Planktothricoides]KOR33710.1 hypothetical protein AM228_28235 [Planktothricoides sp. SR001]MBD2547593.1 hypothetical protein [Planktothricoides raciborskii FACHB-1370]MBD2586330.1 hypothetical protein [Planktothricoides raciborskii FACHB-1261]
MEYIYFFPNGSLSIRVVEYLRNAIHLPVVFVTVIHLIDGWIVRIKMNPCLDPQQEGDFLAVMNELGFPYQPGIRLQMALWSLETGQSAIDVMRRYQVVIVSHGGADVHEIEQFRAQFVKGLGYCPETLA